MVVRPPIAPEDWVGPVPGKCLGGKLEQQWFTFVSSFLFFCSLLPLLFLFQRKDHNSVCLTKRHTHQCPPKLSSLCSTLLSALEEAETGRACPHCEKNCHVCESATVCLECAGPGLARRILGGH